MVGMEGVEPPRLAALDPKFVGEIIAFYKKLINNSFIIC